MKRLFLASSGLEYIKTFVMRNPVEMRMLFIPTAGNLDEDIWWIDKDLDVLSSMGFQITNLDIETASRNDLRNSLKSTDIIYIAGGNTFHLLKVIRDSGFDDLLQEFIDSGGLYAGASAGALVAGVDIAPVATIDEPEKVGGLSSTLGLGLVNIVPIPHYDMPERTKAIEGIKSTYEGEFEIVLLTDDQAIVVEDNDWRIVDSRRNELELAWFKRNYN